MTYVSVSRFIIHDPRLDYVYISELLSSRRDASVDLDSQGTTVSGNAFRYDKS